MHQLYGTLLDWARVLEIYGVPVAISVFYFFIQSSRPLVPRVLASIHGLLFIAALEFASLFGGLGAGKEWRRGAFYLIMALGGASVVFSLFATKVRPIAHLAQILNVSHAMTLEYLGELAFDTG
jgi:hypothetical protein